jgi:hypothetical protein
MLLILNFLLQQLISDIIFTLKTYFKVLKSIACVALICKEAGKIRITVVYQIILSEENKRVCSNQFQINRWFRGPGYSWSRAGCGPRATS